MSTNRWIIGITGASGTIYARRLIGALVEHIPDIHLDLIVSDAALRVMYEEEGLATAPNRLTAEFLARFSPQADTAARERLANCVHIHNNRNIGASIASGSYRTDGMVVVPCSMKTLGGIAHGYGDNLLTRAADVVLKERRQLILVPRETPLSAIHLENMLTLARLGVAIVPAMPGFYHIPATIDDLVEMMVMKILDQMGFAIDLVARWGEKSPVEAPAQNSPQNDEARRSQLRV